MVDLKNLLSYDIILVFLQKIINITYLPRRRIFYRKHRVVRHSFFDGFHTAAPAVHMKNIYILPKILKGRLMLVSSFHTLINNPAALTINPVDLCKRKAP